MKITLERQQDAPAKTGSFGLSLEDVNYALDGGVYAELLENGSFEAKSVSREGDGVSVREDGGYGWEAYPKGANAVLKIKTDRPLFPENPHYMRLTAAEGGAGMKNKAYDGVFLAKGAEYRATFWLRAYDYRGKAAVGFYKDGKPVCEKRVKIAADGKWRKYSVRLKAKADADAADFAFTLLNAGMVHADHFSVMPQDAILGVFRRDLVRLVKELKPRFLRFPSGRVVGGEGNRYLWKDSVGQRERRRRNWNCWALCGDNFSHYGQSLGVGCYEFFRLAEYLGCKPLPVLYAGGLSQTPSGEQELETYIQDALDLIEFAGGGPDTMWGKLRAELGHPEPFALEMLALEGGDPSKDAERLAFIGERIREKYPKIMLIAPDAGDVAYARLAASPQKDDGSRETVPDGRAVYAEVAAPAVAPSPHGANSFGQALQEAALFTQLERNSDVVHFYSYAPLFARTGYDMWDAGLIRFDGKSAFATANYHVAKLFSLYTGDVTIPLPSDMGGVYASASERENFVFVKIVNGTDETAEAEAGDGFGELNQIVRLEGDPAGFNTHLLPDAIAPKDVAPTAPREAVLPPHSFSVLVFRK